MPELVVTVPAACTSSAKNIKPLAYLHITEFLSAVVKIP